MVPGISRTPIPDVVLTSGAQRVMSGRKLIPFLIKPGRPEMIRTMLVVDDCAAYLRGIKRFSEALGVNVLIVDPEDPTRPIKAQTLGLAKHDVDLIVMDGEMPGPHGAELIRALRDQGFTGYITANSDQEKELEDMLAAGADFKIRGKDIKAIFA